jgi:hypothetical protein
LLARKMRKRYYDQITESQIARIKLPTIQEMKAELLVRLLDPEEGLNEMLVQQLRTRLGLADDYDPKAALGALKANQPVEELEGPPPPEL